MLLLPIFGLISDKFSAGNELMVTFGLRGIACMAFFLLDSPNGNIVMWTFVAINMSSSLQGVIIDSLYSKRLPGDCRGAMMGVKGLVSNLGHLTFVAFSIGTIDYFNSIHKSMVIVSLFDASVFFAVMISLVSAGFDSDEFFGKIAKDKAKEED